VPDNSSGSRKPVDFQFNAKSRDAQRWSKRYAGERITNLNTETKLAVRKIVTDSIRDGVPPRDAAKQIREMVGLNRPQGIALRRYVGGLSPSLTTAAKAKAGIKLKNKMIRRRAITIARTEVIDSLSAGVEKSWQQAQGKGLLGKNAKKEWVTTPVGACAICRPMNGQIVPLSKNFESGLGPLARPTAHPNCRCGIAPVPGVGGPLRGRARRDAARRGEGLRLEPREVIAPSTWERHVQRVDRSGAPVFTAERLRLHRQIQEYVLAGPRDKSGKLIRRATPVKNPEMSVLGGGPASGKTIAKNSAMRSFKGNAAAVDPDEIRAMLPEYNPLVERGAINASAITHKEASYIAKNIIREGQNRNLHMIADGTGDGNYASFVKKIAGYRKRGAGKITANYVTIETDEAMRRMLKRASSSGRYVPEDVLRSTHSGVSKVVPRALSDNLFDDFSLWDNNAFGQEPVLIARWKKGEVLEILDDKKWRRFLAKGGKSRWLNLRRQRDIGFNIATAPTVKDETN
jgi:predicted ABC-type ATPase